MAKENLSGVKYVERGYGQVEPNHLSAQRTGQIYAQLPADPEIEMLQNGQFVKYDYAKGLVDFEQENTGEWMLVYNEVKVYRDFLYDADFAMINHNYIAKVYNPVGGDDRDLGRTRNYQDITTPADPYEVDSVADPFAHSWVKAAPGMMPEGTRMVPRVFKTNVGDIFTTNMIDEEELELGNILAPRAADGILVKDDTQDMKWQVVKVYTMPDHQKGVKLMRIA
jgi:hypothetical protein